MSRKLALLTTLLLSVATVGVTQAQVRFGPQIAWGDDADLAVGARAILGLAAVGGAEATNLDGILSFNYFLDCESCNYMEFDVLGRYNFAPTGTVQPYAQGGFDIAYFSVDLPPGVNLDASDTKIGLAAGGGINFLLGALNAFADGRITLGGAEQLVLSFGILFGG